MILTISSGLFKLKTRTKKLAPFLHGDTGDSLFLALQSHQVLTNNNNIFGFLASKLAG